MFKTVVRGGKEIERALKQFAAQARTDILDEAIERGAATFESEARQRAEVAIAGLGDKLAVDMQRKGASVRAQIGMDVQQGWEAYTGLWAEYGTSQHPITTSRRTLVIDGRFVGRSVKHPGSPARPWLTPAFDASHQRALADTEAVMAAALEKVRA